MADVFREFGGRFLKTYGASHSHRQLQVLRDLSICRTAELGARVDRCSHCGYERILYNSCCDRHCPTCQAAARGEWLQQREAELLPVPYFHVVFTIPPAVADLALQNPEVVYRILFHAASATLTELAADGKHLGAEIGILAVLHTWGQRMGHHPHVHCIVTGGGVSADGSRWIASRGDYFLPVPVMKSLFRGKFLAMLKQAFDAGELSFFGRLAGLADRRAFNRWLTPLYRTGWIVYCKPPFASPTCVLKYLARYTHRVAISNERLVSIQDGEVTFTWKDYAHGGIRRTRTLPGEEFIRSFLLHVLPKNFVRIRYYGLWSNSGRNGKLAHCRRLLGEPEGGAAESAEPPATQDGADRKTAEEAPLCPSCQIGRLRLIGESARPALGDRPPLEVLFWDTS